MASAGTPAGLECRLFFQDAYNGPGRLCLYAEVTQAGAWCGDMPPQYCLQVSIREAFLFWRALSWWPTLCSFSCDTKKGTRKRGLVSWNALVSQRMVPMRNILSSLLSQAATVFHTLSAHICFTLCKVWALRKTAPSRATIFFLIASLTLLFAVLPLTAF